MNLHNLFEGLKDPKDNPCWKGYHPVGTKQKDGRTVPNCVPGRADEAVEEGSAQELNIQQLATISDEALDKAYGYGRSTPGNSFGWQANLQSAAYAKHMIDKGVTDIEAISDAIHQGWNVTAQKFVTNPDQFDDTEKLKQAGKLEAKLQQRAKLMKISYAQLDNEEQEKDRVVARALLQAIKGQQSVAEAQTDYQKRRQRERDVDAGKPVKRQPKNPQNDYFARRKKERDMAEGRIVDPKNIDIFYTIPGFEEKTRVIAKNVPATTLDLVIKGLLKKYKVNPKNIHWTPAEGEEQYGTRIAEDQTVRLSPNISARPNQDPDSSEEWDYYYKDVQIKPGQDFHTQIKDQHLRQMDPAYDTMRNAFDNPAKPGKAVPYQEPQGDTIIPSRPQEPEKMKDAEGNPVRLRDYVPGDPRISESRLYYNVIGTADKELRTDFGMRKDKNGWYLKESSNVKYRMMAQRAFGSPKLQEYNFPAGSATKGSDNVISPVGSIPRNKINNK